MRNRSIEASGQSISLVHVACDSTNLEMPKVRVKFHVGEPPKIYWSSFRQAVRASSKRAFAHIASPNKNFGTSTSKVDLPFSPPVIQHNGSPPQQRKGYIGLGHPLLTNCPAVAQDHPRAGRRTDLQAREEGRHSLSV